MIVKLEKGFETILYPVRTAYKYNTTEEKHSELMKEYEKLEKSAEVSGTSLSYSERIHTLTL